MSTINVCLSTSKGDILLELDAVKAPVTVANFLSYVDSGFYDGTIFHRVINGFMVQGGGFLPGMTQKPARTPIKNESANGLSNRRGTISMARTNAPDSATCQFFINLVDNQGLDRKGPSPMGAGYCVFGKVSTGMETVDAIASAAVGPRLPHDDVPVEDIIIHKAMRAV
jgi:peptidyl-prolyl cis-trans isomerase B (cyclophilin B)